MKTNIKNYFISLILIIIPSTFFISSVNKIFLNQNYNKKSIKSPFFFKNENESQGFKHVNFKQFEIYNPIKEKYEFYLNDIGKKHLIKRFIESTIIGPEISALKSIIIGDNNVLNKNLGSYYTSANSVFINPIINIKKYKLWQDQDFIQEKRAESVLYTLSHEYNHHFFDSYVSSPIGYSHTNPNTLPSSNIKYLNWNKLKIWNKIFYNDFKKLFFENGIITNKKTIEEDKLNEYKINIKRLLRITQDLAKRKILMEIEKWIQKREKHEKIYNLFNNIQTIFESANEGRLDIQSFLKKDSLLRLGVIMGTNTSGFPYKPFGPIIKYQNIPYFYSMAEQVTRKLLISAFIGTTQKNFSGINNENVSDNLFSNNYIKNNWYRFYSDNVFPTYYQLIKNNLAKSFIQNIVNLVMGHENKSNLSFITNKNSWDVISEHRSRIENENWKKDYDQIKMGGFIDTNKFTHIGYRNKYGEITKYTITIKKFNIWYKNGLQNYEKQFLIGNYYWYLDDYVDKKKMIGKKLIFYEFENGKKKSEQKLKNVRKNKYGIVNNFNSEMLQNDWFKNNFIKSITNNKKWLVVGDDIDGVTIKYYEKEEEVEKIWN